MLSRMFRMAPDPREISNDEAAQSYGADDVVFVDCREPDEWAAGHMPGAIHIPLGQLAAKAKDVPKDKKVIAVCRSGNRSLYAVDILAGSGVQDVKSMAGGMIEWAQKGRPVE